MTIVRQNPAVRGPRLTPQQIFQCLPTINFSLQIFPSKLSSLTLSPSYILPSFNTSYPALLNHPYLYFFGPPQKQLRDCPRAGFVLWKCRTVSSLPASAYEVDDEDSLPTPTTIHYSPAWPRGDDKPLIGRVTHRVLSQTRVGGCPGTAARRPSPAARRTSTTARPSPAARRRVQQRGDESSSEETTPAARRRVQQQGDESSSKETSPAAR